MNKPFWGIYASHLKDFIALKRQLGFKYQTEETTLSIFDRFTIERGESVIGITKELADCWYNISSKNSDSYRYHRVVCLNQFSAYLCERGIRSYIRSLPSNNSTFTPYIFSTRQVKALFAGCDALRTMKKNYNSVVVILPALVRLLYGTGLRISEALALKDSDVNLEDDYLVVRDSKNGKQRMIPISQSVSLVCKEYRKYRDRLPLVLTRDPNLFVSLCGKACKRDSIHKWFHKALRTADITRNDHGPRLHDLRHTFSVHTLAMMAESGSDLQCSLPILSSYLGHECLESTNQYVRLTSEMYPGLLKEVDMVCLNVFPNLEVQYEAN
jgi:integrase/recombinase XerD